jgi:hypothetical protein
MKIDREYQICQAISMYLRYQFPNVIFHFDYAGLHHTKTQAGKMKAIQGNKGYPDLFIAEPGGYYKGIPNRFWHGLFIEIKVEGTKLLNKSLQPATDHLTEQFQMIQALREKGYKAEFGVGFDECKKIIGEYLK